MLTTSHHWIAKSDRFLIVFVLAMIAQAILASLFASAMGQPWRAALLRCMSQPLAHRNILHCHAPSVANGA